VAITYKSQGAGVATEASGGALSPLCPATVDAGDILIAHCGYEGTSTTPDTPADWTLLSGPHSVQSAHRHWIFGKVAVGTEDGAAVAFGTPAVTTMRTARVYSFAGRVAGTIIELVRGFAHLSHATDPQMPTVTTTLAGALAVACGFQMNDNAIANATGETGGDWVESVAEYTQTATTPDSVLFQQTCTPTGDPGTVTGGAIATANDNVGVVGFEIRASAPQLVTAGLGALSLTGFASKLDRKVNLGVGALTLTGFSPIAQVGVKVNTGLGALTLDGFASQANPKINIGLGALTLNGFAPQANPKINVGLGALTLNGFAPQANPKINVGLGALTLTGFEPTVTIGGGVILTGTGELTLTGFVPVATHTIRTALGQLTLTGFAPRVNLKVTAGLGELTLTGLAPAATHTIRTSFGALTLNGFAPQANQKINAGLGALTLTGLEPTASVKINTGLGALTLTGFAPQVNRRINLGFGELALTGFLVNIGGPALPGTGALTLSGFAPQATVKINVGLGALTLTGFAPIPVVDFEAATQTNELLVFGFAPEVDRFAHVRLSQLVGGTYEHRLVHLQQRDHVWRARGQWRTGRAFDRRGFTVVAGESTPISAKILRDSAAFDALADATLVRFNTKALIVPVTLSRDADGRVRGKLLINAAPGRYEANLEVTLNDGSFIRAPFETPLTLVVNP
jgi:hypothetical protein